jgi:hypothetical protein
MQAVYPGSIGTLGEPFHPHPVMTTSSASANALTATPRRRSSLPRWR